MESGKVVQLARRARGQIERCAPLSLQKAFKTLTQSAVAVLLEFGTLASSALETSALQR